jgi:hypothetical protein
VRSVKRWGLFLLFLVLLTAVLFSQDADLRGLKTQVTQLVGQNAVVGKQYAVLIAINKYARWNALRNPVKDAREIREILSRRYYVQEFIELYDEEATKAGIIKLFDRLIRITKPEDAVFIFYAGHGHLDTMSDTGFWVPIDGGTDRYEQLNWLPNTQIRGFISKMKARHILLVSDACFAGDILNPNRAISPEISSEYFRNAYSRVSRQVLTSGASETVPDESPFARGLKLALEGNTSPYLDPLMLYNEVRLGTKGTTPLFGDFRDSGHQEGASFILFLRKPTGMASENKASDMKVTVETTKYGTLRVETEESGTLWIDNIYQTDIARGSSALIENITTGPHRLELRYSAGERQATNVDVSADRPQAIMFSADPSRKVLNIPLLDITIDGKLDDWDTPPAFEDPAGDSKGFEGNLDITRVFIARDLKYMYCRFDIADQRKPTLFRPHNFVAKYTAVFGVFIMAPPSHWVQLTSWYDPGQNRWAAKVDIHKMEWDVDKWETIADGSMAMKGSSMEARFPLKALSPYLQKGSSYQTKACFGCQSEQGAWFQPDETRVQNVCFY